MEQKTVPGMPEVESETPEIIYVGRARAYRRRAGCGCAVMLWALVMLIPGLLVVLATQGEIFVSHGNRVPEPEIHPLVHIKLLMEIETRGVSITTSAPIARSDQETCMQTDVRFLLWQGKGNNVTYCDCYQHDPEGKLWIPVSTTSGACEAG